MSQLGQSMLFLLYRRHAVLIPCRYRRHLVRKVVATFESEEEYKKDTESRQIKKKKPKKVENMPKIDKESKMETSEDEFKLYSEIPEEIRRLKFQKPNPAIVGNFSKMMLNMKSNSYRQSQGTCLLEGKFLISDAMKSGMFIRLLYFSRLQNLVGLPIDILKKTNLIKVGFDEIQQSSEVQIQSEGLLAVATKQDSVTRQKLIKRREEQIQETKQNLLPLTLICDNIRDAGNMGTLLRAAAAAGCEQVLTSKGCVDIWDPKAIRAGAGAHFTLPIVPNLDWTDISAHLKSYNIQNVYLSSPRVGDVKMSELLPDIEEDSELTTNCDETRDFENITFVSKPYYDVRFIDNGHNVIVLGSEVHGVSSNAYLYALERALKINNETKTLCSLVNIPMFQGTECLNTAVAGGILIFEARRQLLESNL